MSLNFECIPFHQLTIFQLYEIMVLRQEVFVVEQNCPYLDADGKDQESWHLMAWNTAGKLVAYARLLPKGVAYSDYPAIGRIVNAPTVRGTGVGRALVQRAIETAIQLFGNEPIKIGAQLYLRQFYQSFGFESVGEEYLEDGILHISMIRKS